MDVHVRATQGAVAGGGSDCDDDQSTHLNKLDGKERRFSDL